MTVKYWPAISDGGGGSGIKCRKPFKPKTMKTIASKYRAMVEAIFIKVSLLACVLCVIETGAPVDLSCLYREIHSGPRREVGRLPARYFVCERNSAVRIRTQVGVRLEVTQHLCYLGGPGEERSENFLWDLLE